MKVGSCMRRSLYLLFTGSAVAAFMLLLPDLGFAQTRKGVKIEEVQIGFGSNSGVSLYKNGAWTPVYILLKAGPDGTDTGGEVIIDSADGDDVHTKYRVAFPQLNREEVYTVLGYTKPGRTDFTFTALMNDKVVSTSQGENTNCMNLGQLLFLTVGSNMQQRLRGALNPKIKKSDNEEDGGENFNAHEGRCLVASANEINKLPKVWFAYEPVDLAILTTGNRDGFVTPLLNEREGRKEALAEWVRRGGKLLVSVGKNQDLLRGQEFEAISSLLPVAVSGTVQVPHLHSVERFAGVSDKPFATPRAQQFEVAKLERKPGRATDTLLYWNPEQKETPLVVQGAYGLGTVTVVAFDLDETPFRGWKGQQGFLDAVVKKAAPAYTDDAIVENSNNFRYGNNAQNFNELGGALEQALEQFDEIPVISFGWVALFILIYILVVGPLDYFFLKKVVKRLELTWITFPTVVITISVAAYFTAYWLKGNDQKINKVDVVDLDLGTQQVYGNTWFTIFSPRIQHYTVGLEPVEPEWAPEPADKHRWPVLVSWMPRQEGNGANRGQSQGLFRRPYSYAEEAAGLIGVPIQVWSTKSFATSWQAAIDPARPLVSADLRLPDKNKPYSGTITSRLPVPLEDVQIYWAGGSTGAWYSLGTLVPNTPKRVDAEFGRTNVTSGWQNSLQSGGTQVNGVTRGRASDIVREAMFFGRAQNGKYNLSLRGLDQNWRLPHEDEVFIIGRIPRTEGAAEAIASGKDSASRIWLGTLPGAGSQRPPLNGTLAQETYVRIIVPVKTTPR